MAIPNSPITRALLFPIAAAADLALSPLYGELGKAIVSLLFLGGGAAVLLWLATKQADYLYDMAARQIANTQTSREARQKGDQSLLVLRAAREGRMKPRTLTWLTRKNAIGKWAILWREGILAIRSNLMHFVLFGSMTVMLSLFPALDSKKTTAAISVMIQFFMIVTVAMVFGQTGFMETLRRVDTQKPLPFNSITVCAMEALGKALMPSVIALIAALALLIAQVGAWQYALAMAMGLPSAAVVVVCVQFIVILLFPDVQDPTQGAFRGLTQFLGAAIAVMPGFVVAVGLAALLPVPIATLGGILVNAGVAAVLLYFAARLYAAYNPSE